MGNFAYSLLPEPIVVLLQYEFAPSNPIALEWLKPHTVLSILSAVRLKEPILMI